MPWLFNYSQLLTMDIIQLTHADEIRSIFVSLTNWGRDKMDATWADIFKCNFVNENVSIAIKIPLNFVPKAPINNRWSLVQVMAWHRTGNKLLSEPMMVILLMHICITLPKWVNILAMLQFWIRSAKSNIDGIIQEICNSIAYALKLRLSCTNPLILLLKCTVLQPQLAIRCGFSVIGMT